MGWPSRNADDYVNQPRFSPAIPREKPTTLGIDELDPAEWREGRIPDSEWWIWMPATIALTIGASVLAGYNVFSAPTGFYFIWMNLGLAMYLARRSAAARHVAAPWPPSRRFAPDGGIPVIDTAAITAAFTLVGAIAIAAATSNEVAQGLALIGVLALSPLPSRFLERRIARRKT